MRHGECQIPTLPDQFQNSTLNIDARLRPHRAPRITTTATSELRASTVCDVPTRAESGGTWPAATDPKLRPVRDPSGRSKADISLVKILILAQRARSLVDTPDVHHYDHHCCCCYYYHYRCCRRSRRNNTFDPAHTYVHVHAQETEATATAEKAGGAREKINGNRPHLSRALIARDPRAKSHRTTTSPRVNRTFGKGRVASNIVSTTTR